MEDIRKLDTTKYYIPELNDLCEGFEFELQEYNEGIDEYTDNWIKHKFDVRSGLSHDDYHTFNDDRVRVEYLTKEQIEEERWIEDKKYKWCFTKDNFMLVYIPESKRLRIGVIDTVKGVFENTSTKEYSGNCRCINDFRKIIKLLGI